MKKDKYLIALAGLFHDIGKFYQRANPKKKKIPQAYHHYLKKENYKNEFRYQHAVYSFIALKTQLNEGLTSVFSQEEIDVIVEGVYHHKPANELQHLIQKADWVSSSERTDKESIYDTDLLPADKKKDLEAFAQNNPRLRSIFENIELDKKSQPQNYFYKITTLSLSDKIFPTSLEKAYIDIEFQGKKEEEILGSYSKQWQLFQEEFNQKLKNSSLSFNSQPEKVFSLIYHLLYKYLWCIPASTYDKENYSNHYPDISLFDHSRVLSAVACCFFDYDRNGFTQKSREKFKEETKDKQIFLHIKADISGIQKFIYNVYEGKGGVAKILRGRSFYVALLPEILSRYILNKLEYPISNLLYSGGGIFELLVANTEKNREKLKKIKIEIDKFLSSKFESDLGLSIGTYQYSPVEMMESYKDVLRCLNQNLDNAKKKRFEKLIDTGDIFDLLNKQSYEIKGSKKKCPVCQTYLIDESLTGEEEICNNCKEFKNIGNHLPKTETLVFSTSLTENFSDPERTINFKEFGAVYLLGKENYTDLQPIYYDKEITEILDINDASFENKYITGFKFMGKSVPQAEKKIKKEEVGEEKDIEKGQIAPFTVLAQYSDGDERIGIIRMDVDNLGRLFSNGLGEKISISRTAALSRMLDLFFAGYLNKICEDLSNEYKKRYTNLKINSFFYILYSGGDDLFIIAPWDKGIDIAEKINTTFKRYTCYNPNVTISAGYFQTKPKFPVRVSAEISGKAEEIAKNSGKNKICILGDILRWEEIEKAKNISEDWVKYIKSGKLQKGFVYAVHRLKEQFLKDESENIQLVFPYRKEENPMFYPYLQYYIARNLKNEDLKEKAANFLLKKKNFSILTFIVNYTALKIRKV